MQPSGEPKVAAEQCRMRAKQANGRRWSGSEDDYEKVIPGFDFVDKVDNARKMSEMNDESEEKKTSVYRQKTRRVRLYKGGTVPVGGHD